MRSFHVRLEKVLGTATFSFTLFIDNKQIGIQEMLFPADLDTNNREELLDIYFEHAKIQIKHFLRENGFVKLEEVT